ncbi:unnamed protein product [Ceutorhynchus assimilis]|uniref:Nucleoside diphosphate kinase-like domain-containing protein n=1 Tax=Ceutorhynchus assimilis TaxID=467358 RepID=A0A9P0GR60_9CUCU|nr:unnamed protein product [Ceutorhynchus assimilis]
MSMSTASSTYSEFKDKEVQTVIKVFPFVLPSFVNRASVTAGKKVSTSVIADPSPVNYQFYHLLQYCPYHDIQLDSLRVIDLPRETRLQFNTRTFSEETLKRISLADDDGVAEVCDDLLLRLRTGNRSTFRETATQTDLTQRTVHLSPEQVSEVYEKYYGTPTFPHMVVTVSAAPILVLSLQALKAVEKWKTMIGPAGTLREEWFFPRSVRYRFGLLGDFPNALHGSEGANDARRENRYFYPRDIQEPLPFEAAKVKDYITTFIKPILLKGLAEIVHKKPIDPVISLAEWLLLHNPNQPEVADFIALTPT